VRDGVQRAGMRRRVWTRDVSQRLLPGRRVPARKDGRRVRHGGRHLRVVRQRILSAADVQERLQPHDVSEWVLRRGGRLRERDERGGVRRGRRCVRELRRRELRRCRLRRGRVRREQLPRWLLQQRRLRAGDFVDGVRHRWRGVRDVRWRGVRGERVQHRGLLGGDVRERVL
jgi:hypothetical protein